MLIRSVFRIICNEFRKNFKITVRNSLMGFILKRLLLNISVILLRKFRYKKTNNFLGLKRKTNFERGLKSKIIDIYHFCTNGRNGTLGYNDRLKFLIPRIFSIQNVEKRNFG